MGLANMQDQLSRAEMKDIIAGNQTIIGEGTCFLRCDQNSSDGIDVSNCSRETVESKCTGSTTPVCICG
jgi:hypothetical protein